MSTLQALHDLLRDETKWPAGFEWNYSLHTSCALGLAVATGLVEGSIPGPGAFELTGPAWMDIFQRPARGSACSDDNYSKVTPAIVARRIKRHLKARAAP